MPQRNESMKTKLFTMTSCPVCVRLVCVCVCSTITLEKFDYSLHLCVRAHMLILMRVAGRFCLKIGKWKSSGGRREALRGKKREGERERERSTVQETWKLGNSGCFLTASKRKRTVEGDKTETEKNEGWKRRWGEEKNERVSKEKEGKMGRKRNCRG